MRLSDFPTGVFKKGWMQLLCSTSWTGRNLSIVDLMMGMVAKELEEKEIGLETTDAAREYLGEKGFDPVLGAGLASFNPE
ncbi:MAG: hypothetical protein Ct9H300mP27_08070 [Chloroflexota bacterium]|nr:MAG: hypothetical protein Ct9H300mP27_08070 [Chloroflexota bacterium]